MTNSRLFFFRYDKKNYVAGRHTIFYDYADHQQYRIVGISRNSFDIMNVTEREVANVKKMVRITESWITRKRRLTILNW